MSPAKLWYKGWNERDVDLVLTSLADDVKMFDIIMGPHLTKADTGPHIALFVAAFPDYVIDPVDELVTPEGGFFEWRMHGTNTGPFLNKPATGKKFDMLGVDIMRFRGDKIVSLRGYWDVKTFSKQLGLDFPL